VAASPRPPSWAIGHTEFNAGVLGETAPAVAGRRRALGIEGMSREWRVGRPKLGMGVVGWGDENWVCAV